MNKILRAHLCIIACITSYVITGWFLGASLKTLSLLDWVVNGKEAIGLEIFVVTLIAFVFISVWIGISMIMGQSLNFLTSRKDEFHEFEFKLGTAETEISILKITNDELVKENNSRKEVWETQKQTILNYNDRYYKLESKYKKLLKKIKK